MEILNKISSMNGIIGIVSGCNLGFSEKSKYLKIIASKKDGFIQKSEVEKMLKSLSDLEWVLEIVE